MTRPRETECEQCALNGEPAAYVDATWLASMSDADVLIRLRSCARARPALSRHIIERMAQQSTVLWSSEHDPLRLALLDPLRLRDLVLKAGACLVSAALRALVSGVMVRALVGEIGPDAHAFALRHGAALCERHALPERAMAQDEAPAAAVLDRGTRLVAAATAGMDPAVAQRLLWKLPLAWSRDDPWQAPPIVEPAVAQALLRDILKEADHAGDDGEGLA